MRKALILLVALATAFALAMPVVQAEEADSGDFDQVAPVEEGDFDSYIVVMDEDPLTAHIDQEDLGSPAAEAKAEDLKESHDDVLEEEGLDTGDKVHDYVNALNGFSAILTHAEAEKLAANSKVAMVVPDELQQATTDSSPSFIGVSGRNRWENAWAAGYTGKGVVVGIIDTGIWPEHPSFEDHGMPAPPVTGIPCEFGNTTHNPADAPFTCNNKLIGARQVLDTYRFFLGAEANEFDSARDDNGHGTHTASTAAGDKNVQATAFGKKVAKISGIAYDAHIIAYKGLGEQGGFTSDLAAAIDQAVEDGVDVINYSIGGGPSLTGADDIAFLFAADAGVYVATSAGNSGPGPETVGGPGTVPWITTVGANTQSRFFQGKVVIKVAKTKSGAELDFDRHSTHGFGWFGWYRDYWRGVRTKTYTFEGASLTQDSGWAPLVDGADAGDEQCNIGALDPAVVTGAIVLCKRGVTGADPGRAEKGAAVADAGGVGMVLYNVNDVDNLFTDPQRVPTVHVDQTPGLEIKDLIASGKVIKAKIDAGQKTKWKSAPSMTIFSSRGPNPAAEDIIKPDVTAPGMQILAGNSPMNTEFSAQGELFQSIAGTSMSSPHVAGLFALISQAHPDWTPAMAKSALMTTADRDVRDNDRVSQAGVFAMGAGHVDPGGKGAGSAFNPGLVYDAGFLEYLGFLCDAEPTALSPTTCPFLETNGIPTDASDLNLASIGIGELAGSQTITRTVTSVASKTLKYKVKVKAPAGYDVSVSPSSFTIAPGESVTYTVTIDNLSGPIGEWRTGSIEWRSGDYRVYSPVAVKAALFDAADQVDASGESGTASFNVTFGYTGSYTAAPHGPVSATVTSENVVQDPDQNFDPNDGFSNAHVISVTDAAYLRIELPPESVSDPDAIDLDIYLYDPNGVQVAASTSGGTDEGIDIMLPEDGNWTLYVHGWQTAGPSADYTMWSWVIPNASGGTLMVDNAPSAATIGATEPVDVSWSGATAGQWHLGAVSHTGDAGLMGLTLINIDNR